MLAGSCLLRPLAFAHRPDRSGCPSGSVAFKVLRKYKASSYEIVQLMVPKAMAQEVSLRFHDFLG